MNNSHPDPRNPHRRTLFARGSLLRGAVCAAASLLLWASPPQSPAQIVTDDFDSGALSSDWQQRNVCQPLGGYVGNSFPANGAGKAFRIQRGSFNAAPLGIPQAYGTGRAWLFRTNLYTDFYVAVDLVAWNNTTNQALVLLARASGYDDVLQAGFPPGLGTVDGLVCNYDCAQWGDGATSRRGGQFQINLVTNEATRTVSAVDLTLVPDRAYRQIFKSDGPTLIAQIYDLEDLTAPIVTVRTNAESWTSGVSGLVSYHRGGTHPNLSDMTVDNYYSAPTDPNADIAPAIRHPIAGTPQVVTRTPVARAANFHPAASGISFNARTFTANPIKASATKLYLNGKDVSASLAPLPADGNNLNFATAPGTLAANTVYAARIELEDVSGALKSTNTFWFDTFTDAYISAAPALTIEAEDYNFSFGQFIPPPIPVSGQKADGTDVNLNVGYYGMAGIPSFDYNDVRTTPEGGWGDYRGADNVGTVLGNRGDLQDGWNAATDPAWSRPNDTIRQKYSALGLKEYHVTRTQAGEWLDYTRAFGGRSYKVYLRCGSYGAQDVGLNAVTVNPMDYSLAAYPLGLFPVPNHMARFNYRYVPLSAWGYPSVLHLDGEQTIRLSVLGSVGKDDLLLQFNYLLFVPSGDGMVLGDNFDDGNDSAPAPGWGRYDPLTSGSYSFPNGNSYRLQAPPSPDPAAYGPARVGALAPCSLGDFCVIADIVDWDDSIRQVAGVMARTRKAGLASTTGYLFTHDRGNPASSTQGDMDIVRVDNEAGTSLSTTGNDSLHFVPGKKYRLVFTGIGSQLRGRVYELPNVSTPVVDISATDSTYTSGAAGLLVVNNAAPTYAGAADATFDNFAALSAEPVLTVTSTGGSVKLSWPILPMRLEWTPSLTTPSWTTVATGIVQVGNEYQYTLPGPTLSGFYRLAAP